MLIAIATTKKNENSQISSQAGLAPYYLIFNQQGELIEAIKNPFTVGGGGAGFAVAKMLADKQVNLVIAGKFGPNMIGALEERNVKFKEKQGTADKALSEICPLP